MRIAAFPNKAVLVVQWIEHRFPKPVIRVRIPARAPYKLLIIIILGKYTPIYRSVIVNYWQIVLVGMHYLDILCICLHRNRVVLRR